MTKDKKASRMPVSEKRRSAALAHAAVSRAASPSPASQPRRAASTTTRTAPAAGQDDIDGTSSTGGIIAAPPRAQLGASGALEDQTYKETAAAPVPKEQRENSAPSGTSPLLSPATAALLREKDQRIADLEGELTRSTSEFSQLLDALSQKESEAATYWQDRQEQTAGQLAQAQGEIALLRAEMDIRDAEKEELTKVWDSLTGQLAEREREASELRAQVRGLKEFVSTSTRTDGQAATSDEVFGEGMARLGNGLQNWVMVHFRKAKMDITRATDETRLELEELVPAYEGLAKIHLIQTLVSRILVEMVFETYYVGLSDEQTVHLRTVESMLSSLGSEESAGQWRSATLAILRRETDAKWQAETESFIGRIVKRINGVLDAIMDAQAFESRDNALRTQVSAAVDMARLVAVQKAVFTVHMPVILPHQQTLFDAAVMEDIGGEDEDGLMQREISCVTFPGMIKHGDEGGGQLHYRNVIAKARVLCSPE